MHDPVRLLRLTMPRLAPTSVALVGFFMAGADAALATGTGSDTSGYGEPTTVTFGLLGPVGLAAVALGILGMAAGVLRQRRRSRAAAPPAAAAPAAAPEPAGFATPSLTVMAGNSSSKTSPTQR